MLRNPPNHAGFAEAFVRMSNITPAAGQLTVGASERRWRRRSANDVKGGNGTGAIVDDDEPVIAKPSIARDIE